MSNKLVLTELVVKRLQLNYNIFSNLKTKISDAINLNSYFNQRVAN